MPVMGRCPECKCPVGYDFASSHFKTCSKVKPKVDPEAERREAEQRVIGQVETLIDYVHDVGLANMAVLDLQPALVELAMRMKALAALDAPKEPA